MSKLKPMKAYIGKWKEQIDGPDFFEVHAVADSTDPAEIRKIVKGLPFGTYTMLTGRKRLVRWFETKTQTLDIEAASGDASAKNAREPEGIDTNELEKNNEE